MWLSLLSVLANKRQAVWEADLKAVRGGSSVGQTSLLLGDSLFSKELENMGKQLAGKHYYVVCMYAFWAFVFTRLRGYLLMALMTHAHKHTLKKKKKSSHIIGIHLNSSCLCWVTALEADGTCEGILEFFLFLL